MFDETDKLSEQLHRDRCLDSARHLGKTRLAVENSRFWGN